MPASLPGHAHFSFFLSRIACAQFQVSAAAQRLGDPLRLPQRRLPPALRAPSPPRSRPTIRLHPALNHVAPQHAGSHSRVAACAVGSLVNSTSNPGRRRRFCPPAASSSRPAPTPPVTGSPSSSDSRATLCRHSRSSSARVSAAIRVGCEQEWLPITWPRRCRSRSSALAEKSRSADAVRGDEEMPAPAARLQQVRDRMVKAHAAIVEGEQHGSAPFSSRTVVTRRPRRRNRVQVPREILAPQFVHVRAFAGKSARFEIAVLHHVVIHDRVRPHALLH